MGLIIVCSVAVCLALVLVLRLLIRKVAVAGGRLPLTAEWIDELSMERYRPMMRLLDSEDLIFLRSQAGFTRRMETHLRCERCQIFRGYLDCLQADFVRVCAAIKVLMLQSRDDRPELAAALVRQQAAFACGMLLIEVRLLLYRWGLCSVDATSLVTVFDSMRIELRSMVPATVYMSA